MFQYLLLLAAGFVSLLPSCAAVDFYVLPTNSPNQTCHGQPCYTLDQYAQNISLFKNQSNISLLFLIGDHNLTQDLNINNRDEVLVKSLSADDEKVVINMQADIHVTNVNVFETYNITIIGKPTTRFYPKVYIIYVTGAETITQYQVETENIGLNVDNNSTEGQTVSITKCNYSSTTGFGFGLWFTAYSDSAEMVVKIQSTKISNNATIKDTGFTFVGSALTFDCFYQTQHFGSPFLTVDIQDSDIRGWGNGAFFSCQINNLAIERTNITDNHNGISIKFTKVNNLAVKNTRFINNQISGINLLLLYTEVENFTVQDTHFENNGIKGTPGFAGGIIVNGYKNTVKNLTLKDTIFESNHPYGVMILGTNKIAIIIKDTIIRDCQFGISFTLYTKQPGNVLSCDNCTIASNYGTGIALINIQDKVIVHNSRFYDNKDTPIVAYESQIELSGATTFENNTAIRGGGLSLIYSYVYFANQSYTIFRNNLAKEFGGAIYIVSKRYVVQTSFRYLITDQQLVLPQIPCFYQVNVSSGGAIFGTQVHFINNKAKLGGHAIYGAPLNARDTCSNINGRYPLRNEIFNFKEIADKSSSLSSIASDPIRVCFCDNSIPQCENTTIVYNETSYPGENFNISLVLVGYNYGTVTGSIYANLLSSGHSGRFGGKQHIQAADCSSCNTLVYSIYSNLTKPFEVIKLTANEQEISENDIEHSNEIAASCTSCNTLTGCTTRKPCPALLTIPIYINVTLAKCPLGFKLENGRCECDEHLKDTKNNITCQITDHTGYIHRLGTVWVGVDQTNSFCYSSNTNNTCNMSSNIINYYLSSEQCPNGYCKTERTAVNLFEPDSQCSNNHAGNLCGRCKSNHSLLLGSDRCFDCRDNYGLALLIFFVAAGFLLVFFIKFLDLTVAHGTVNGLIFYANIVWSYNSILFPVHGNIVNGTAGYNVLSYYNILRVLIAWINLDYGFETCFFQGMDASTKTWLQFVFPIYIWSIAGFIILLCHYSFKATKLFGNNAISVLATLFLLSYSKLLHTITNTFTYASLQYSHRNDTLSVWALDGTVVYWDLTHWPLFLAGLACFLFLWIPYTSTMLFVPCLKRWDHLKPFRWINKLKPFYDSYYGPFKDNIHCQCWVGVLLIVRGMVVIVFASTNNTNANVLFLVVITTTISIYNAMIGRQYRKWYVSLLENLYILNLGILAGAFLFTQTNGQSNTNSEENAINPAIVVSASLALLQFACIAVFHIIRRCQDVVCKCRRGEGREIINEPNPPPPQTNNKNLDRSHYNSNRLRESIMESSIYGQRLI